MPYRGNNAGSANNVAVVDRRRLRGRIYSNLQCRAAPFLFREERLQVCDIEPERTAK